MGLQPYAVKEVEGKIRELWDAYVAGHNWGGEYFNFPSAEGFRFWLKNTHPLLADYCDLDLIKRFQR